MAGNDLTKTGGKTVPQLFPKGFDVTIDVTIARRTVKVIPIHK